MELAIVVVTVTIVAFSLVSGLAERSPFTAPMVFTGLGLGLGAVGVLGMDLGNEVIHVLAELTLILVLFTDASRIDLTCLRQEPTLPARLLAIGMPLTILAGAGLAMALFPGLTWVEAGLLAAILTPTDAALGQAVVSNPAVPVRIRQTLNVESGLNDGIALPVVLLLGSMAGAVEEGGGAAFWVQFVLLAVTLGPVVGVAVGAGGGYLLEMAVTRGWVNDAFSRLGALALAPLAYVVAELVGGNGFIAAFAAGFTMGNVARAVSSELHEFGEAEGQLFALLVFVVFGASLVPEALAYANGAAVLYALASLTVVRMVPVALSLLGTGLKAPTTAFLGWFGPRGLASILFLLLIIESGMLASGPMLQSVVVLTVLFSILLHGLTAYPLAARYGAWVADQEDTHEEQKEMVEMPVRIRHRV